MGELFGRVARVTVGTLRVSGLRVTFKVSKGVSSEPNTMDLSLYNLSETSRAKLRDTSVPVILEAGYRSNAMQLFSGDARTIQHQRRGPDIITRVQCGDGERAYATARTSASFAPGAQLVDVMRQLKDDMGVNAGNAMARVAEGDFAGAVDQFVHGLSLHGKTSDCMTQVVGAAGLTWSIQDDALQVLAPGEPTMDEAVVLSSSTGLVGSPEIGEEGAVKFTSLLQPALRPGRRVDLRAQELRGMFRVERVTHNGDTHGGQWQSEVEARAL